MILGRCVRLLPSAQRRLASTLVVSEHNNTTLHPSTLSTITAATKIGGDITVLVCGSGCAGVATAASKVKGVTKVIRADAPHLAKPVAENLEKLVTQIQAAGKFTHILSPANAALKSAMPRIAARLGVDQISEVTAVVSEDTFVRPIYAGNALATVQSGDAVKVVTARPTAFDKAPDSGGAAAPVEEVAAGEPAGLAEWVGEELSRSERPDLATASVVVSGGRGLKSGDNFKLLYELADKLGAAVGASRAAVDAGYAPNDYQIGQTGKVVAPDLYIAVGISGATQHLAGMKDSKTIVAINKDPDAPIFQVADLGLVEDLFKAVPALTSALPPRN